MTGDQPRSSSTGTAGDGYRAVMTSPDGLVELGGVESPDRPEDRGHKHPSRPDVQPLLERMHHDVRSLSVLLGVPGFPWETDEQQATARAAAEQAAFPLRIMPWTRYEFRQVGPETWDWMPAEEPVMPGADITGAQLIKAERRRQVMVEGFTEDHDRRHGAPALYNAASCYERGSDLAWPWAAEDWKPKNRVRDLVRAGALYVAAGDLLAEKDAMLRSCAQGVARCAAAIDELLDEARAILGGAA